MQRPDRNEKRPYGPRRYGGVLLADGRMKYTTETSTPSGNDIAAHTDRDTKHAY